MNLQRIHNVLAFIGWGCLFLAGGAAAGIVPAAWGMGFGLAGLVANGLAAAPVFSPTDGSPIGNKILVTISTLAGLVGASSYFSGVQALMQPGHAQKLAAMIVFFGQAAARLAQSGLIPTGAIARSAMVFLAAGLALGSSGCAHVDAIAKDVTGCVKADESAAVVDLERAAPKIVEDILMCAPGGEAAIPMCVEQGLQSLVVALGPDGERFRLCVVNAIENDPEAAPLAKQRAKAVRVKLNPGHASKLPECRNVEAMNSADLTRCFVALNAESLRVRADLRR